MSKSGRAVSKFLSDYPDKNVFVLTNNYKVRSLLKLYKNDIHVIPVDINEPATVDILWNSIVENKDTIFFKTIPKSLLFTLQNMLTHREPTV